MTEDQERWAEALAIERRFGRNALAHIATMVSELALAGDEAGVQRWIAIAERFDQLQPEQVGSRQ
ncbi:DUF6961 family protein [Sphingobium sp. HWE2-09]|uniref:DUF6961 family protein n=1 Tax=Sphingobium sp. HWE2-09 TaxID=3108390 RepID=UPI002DC37767|nr:hypothetical protein [Sphingobium sp. HWE2-09]